jgi:histone H3/H4
MINKTKIKKFVKEKTGKSISKRAIAKIEKTTIDEIERKIIFASRKADFAGRKTIRIEDMDNCAAHSTQKSSYSDRELRAKRAITYAVLCI